MHTVNRTQKLTGAVQIFRLRVAAAEAKLKMLREQAAQAKRRRKEAKRIAQHARKQFKQAKEGLSELKQLLAKAEANLFQAGGRALARTLAKRKPVVKVDGSKKTKTTARRPRPVRLAASRPPVIARPGKSVIRRSEVVSPASVLAPTPDPNQSTLQPPDEPEKSYEQ